MSSRLTRSNRAGWAFALPGFGLIAMFIIVPFLFAFGLSLTNQRLVSPNPTEYVGFENYSNLLSLGIVGSYAWRAYENTKGRPQALVLKVDRFFNTAPKEQG